MLSSISRDTYEQVEIIVVDNGSVKDETGKLKEQFPEYSFIRSERNLGFAGGNNLGLTQASGDYLFFVNNDTEFTTGLLQRLVDVLENNPQVGIVSPKILYFDHPGQIQYAGFSPMNYFTGRNRCIGQYETDRGQYDGPAHPTGYAHGAAMLVRRDAIEKAGPMPENFFLYYEEMDWCERIRDAGYRVWIEPNAKIFHKESLSTGRNSPLKEYFMTRNRILFIRRNAATWHLALFIIYFMLAVIPRNMAVYIVSGRMDLSRQFWRAISWNITHNKASMELGFKI